MGNHQIYNSTSTNTHQKHHINSVSLPTAQRSRYAHIRTPASDNRGTAVVVSG